MTDLAAPGTLPTERDQPPPASAAGTGGAAVPSWLDRAAGWSWRALVVGGGFLAAGYALSELRLVVLPVVVALMLSTLLEPPARWLRQVGWRPLLATWTVMAGFLAAAAVAGALVAPPIVVELGALGDTLDVAGEEIEGWLVDGPVGLEQERVAEIRDDLTTTVADAVSADGVRDGAVLAGEVLAGILLALVATFFVVKDGRRIQAWALASFPDDERARLRASGRAAWEALGGFLRGAALLGTIEAAVVGGALAVTGSTVVLPVAALTFVAAFVPFVGALVAGVVAALVALVSGGPGAALLVGGAALVVQQLDNDVLAPFVYGRMLHLHPLVVILAVATGATVGGVLGAFLAVPTVATVVSATSAWRAQPVRTAPAARR